MKRTQSAKRVLGSPTAKIRKTTGNGLTRRHDDPSWCDGSIFVSSPFLLSETLMCGQAFRWIRVGENLSGGFWAGVIHHRVYLLQQLHLDPNSSLLFYKCAGSTASRHVDSIVPPSPGSPQYELHTLYNSDEHEALLKDYFRLERCTNKLWRDWTSSPDGHPLRAHFVHTAAQFKGVRILRQDPLECLMSFICSQNNNIQRITRMLNSLCEEFGDPIPLCADWRSIFPPTMPEEPVPRFSSFPSIATLATVDEASLRNIGFGYRARYIPRAASAILAKNTDMGEGVDWLYNLRLPCVTGAQSQRELCTLFGVGPKVGDCVSLFSLDKLDVTPVDTHIWQIAQRYIPALQLSPSKTLTPTVYKSVGAAFSNVFGSTCGWAHALLFAAELPSFQKWAKEVDDQDMGGGAHNSGGAEGMPQG